MGLTASMSFDLSQVIRGQNYCLSFDPLTEKTGSKSHNRDCPFCEICAQKNKTLVMLWGVCHNRIDESINLPVKSKLLIMVFCR